MYTENKYPDNLHIHHDYDENDDVSTLSASCKASFICDKIKSMTNNIPEDFIFTIVCEEVLKISRLTTISFFGEVAAKHPELDNITKKRDNSVISQLLQLLLEETIGRTCTFLGIEIYKRIAASVLEQFVITETIPYEIYEKMLFEAMQIHIVSQYEAKYSIGHLLDVSIFDWRSEIGSNLFELFTEKICDIVHTFQESYTKTKRNLLQVCLPLEKLKIKCRPSNMSECKYFFGCVYLMFDMMFGY